MNRRNSKPRVVIFAPGVDSNLYGTDQLPDQRSERGYSVTSSIVNQDLGNVARYADAIGVPPPFGARSAVPMDARSIGSSQNRSAGSYGNQETASTTSGNSRFPRRPVRPDSRIRTDFTTTGGGVREDDAGTPQEDYEQLCTPPGEPPVHTPEEIVHPALSQAPRHEKSMRTEWLFVVVIVSIGVGIALFTQKPDAEITYWITTIGSLYERVVACITLPMAFCQVVMATAELSNNGTLRRTYKYTAIYFLFSVFVSVWVMLLIAMSVKTLYIQNEAPNLQLRHPPFAFKCHNGRYVEQQANGQLKCTGTAVSANTTFPHVVDLYQRMGIEEPVGMVDITGYIHALFDVYFPGNLVKALARDNWLSSMICAVVLGIAIAKSFSSQPGAIKRSRNPLFRLVAHIYLSLYTILDWVQNLVLWFTVPIVVAAVLAIPELGNTLHVARHYALAVILSAYAQCLLVVPILVYGITKQNPYKYIWQMLPPAFHAFILQSAFLPLAPSTKATIRSRLVAPDVFGSVFPLLSALNRSAFALGLTNALVYTAAFSGCNLEVTPSRIFLFFGTSLMACFGDTMLPRTGLTLFLTMWRSFCQNEDTPGAVLMIVSLGILTYRLAAVANVLTNVQIIRLVSYSVDKSLQAERGKARADLQSVSGDDHLAVI